MLYQKGEKLAELRQTIKEIPIRSGLKESDFAMSKSELKKFERPIINLFNNLNSVLFTTLFNSKTTDENRNDVYCAVEKIVRYLEEHFKQDLKDCFFEEKLAIYENMFVILVRDKLSIRYKDYKNLLELIPKAYWNISESYQEDFKKLSHLLETHDNITTDMDSKVFYSTTYEYLEHALEMVYEEISETIKRHCEAEYLNSNVLPNELRKLIYLIRTELPIAFEEDETDKE